MLGTESTPFTTDPLGRYTRRTLSEVFDSGAFRYGPVKLRCSALPLRIVPI